MTLRKYAGSVPSENLDPIELVTDLLGGLLVGGWDPGYGGPWQGDTFEVGRYYEGEWEGV